MRDTKECIYALLASIAGGPSLRENDAAGNADQLEASSLAVNVRELKVFVKIGAIADRNVGHTHSQDNQPKAKKTYELNFF